MQHNWLWSCRYFKILFKNDKNHTALAFHHETQHICENRAKAESIYNLLLQTAPPLSFRETYSGRQPHCESYHDGPGFVVSLLNGSCSGKEHIHNACLVSDLVLCVQLGGNREKEAGPGWPQGWSSCSFAPGEGQVSPDEGLRVLLVGGWGAEGKQLGLHNNLWNIPKSRGGAILFSDCGTFSKEGA